MAEGGHHPRKALNHHPLSLKEICLYDRDPNAPSAWSELGGKQQQHSVRR